ncbi:MAG: hypothetical protein AAFR67_16015, partial [Chloroflexota bacterium]
MSQVLRLPLWLLISTLWLTVSMTTVAQDECDTSPADWDVSMVWESDGSLVHFDGTRTAKIPLHGQYLRSVEVSDAYVAWVTSPTYKGFGLHRLFVWNGVCTTQLTTYFPPERGSLQYDLSGHTVVWRDAIDMQWNGTDRIVVWNGATNTLTNLDSANSNWDVRTDGEHVVWRSCNYDCQLLLWDGSEIITVTPYQ